MKTSMTSERCQGCGGTGFYAPGPLGRDACVDCGGTGQTKCATPTTVAVAWLDAFGKPHRCRQDAINDFGYEPEPLHRVGDIAVARQNAAMAQTSREKQEAFRARQAMLGRKEVRGIYLPEELHAALKEHAAKLLNAYRPKEKE